MECGPDSPLVLAKSIHRGFLQDMKLQSQGPAFSLNGEKIWLSLIYIFLLCPSLRRINWHSDPNAITPVPRAARQCQASLGAKWRRNPAICSQLGNLHSSAERLSALLLESQNNQFWQERSSYAFQIIKTHKFPDNLIRWKRELPACYFWRLCFLQSSWPAPLELLT